MKFIVGLKYYCLSLWYEIKGRAGTVSSSRT